MQKFSFPLDRVLAWRRIQRDRELANLERLLFARKTLQARESAIRTERDNFDHTLSRSLSFDGGTLETLPRWHAKLRSAISELESERRQLGAKITAQEAVVRDRERDVKLLERLREKRYARWAADLNREQETFAAEAFLASVVRRKTLAG